MHNVVHIEMQPFDTVLVVQSHHKSQRDRFSVTERITVVIITVVIGRLCDPRES